MAEFTEIFFAWNRIFLHFNRLGYFLVCHSCDSCGFWVHYRSHHRIHCPPLPSGRHQCLLEWHHMGHSSQGRLEKPSYSWVSFIHQLDRGTDSIDDSDPCCSKSCYNGALVYHLRVYRRFRSAEHRHFLGRRTGGMISVNLNFSAKWRAMTPKRLCSFLSVTTLASPLKSN